MKKLTLLFLLSSLFLLGRENPFAPNGNEKSISNNNQKKYYKFKENNLSLPSSARVMNKVIITYTNIDGSSGEVSKDIDRKIDWHEPIVFTHKNTEEIIKKDSFREIELKDTNFVSIYFLDKDFKIKTPYKIKKHFFQSKPYRIVIDFDGIVRSETIEKTLKEKYFNKVTISSHEDFFRIVLELDSFYEYIITDIDGGYMLGVR